MNRNTAMIIISIIPAIVSLSPFSVSVLLVFNPEKRNIIPIAPIATIKAVNKYLTGNHKSSNAQFQSNNILNQRTLIKSLLSLLTFHSSEKHFLMCWSIKYIFRFSLVFYQIFPKSIFTIFKRSYLPQNTL